MGYLATFLIPTERIPLQQVNTLTPSIDALYGALKSALQNAPYAYLQQWSGYLPASLSAISVPPSPAASGALINSFSWTLNIAQSILDGLFTLSVVLLIGFYWTIEGERVEYAFSLLLPPEKRESTREMIRDIETRVGGYVRGIGLLALAIGGMTLVAYFFIGLPSVLSLAFLAGMFELVPLFGPTLGALPALLVTLESNPSKILWVILVVCLIQFLENHFLAPRVMKKTVGVNPIVTILAMTGFGFLFGFVGTLMAIPLAAVFQVILERSLLRPEGAQIKAPPGRDHLTKLSYEAQEFVQDVRKLVRQKTAGDQNDEVEDAIESIAAQLDGLLSQTIEPDDSQ